MFIYVWKNLIHLIYVNMKTARWSKYATRILHVVDTPYKSENYSFKPYRERKCVENCNN